MSFYEEEEEVDWRRIWDNPVLKQRVIQATRRYVEDKFADETEDLQVSVSVVDDYESFRYKTQPEYSVKVVADFRIETDSDSSGRALNKVIRKINRSLKWRLNPIFVNYRKISAKVGVFPKGTDVYLRLVYVGPSNFDDVVSTLNTLTLDDYFRGIITNFKKDIDRIHQILGNYFK